jgi:polar amino acid transport system substrate-binding protein
VAVKAALHVRRVESLRCARAATVLGLVLAALALPPRRAGAAEGVTIPNFWDPRARLEKPDLAGLKTIRFITEDEFPPLHFAGPDGPTGFSVELARAACDRLGVACTVQARRFDTMLDALAGGQGDVVAAAVPITAELRRRFDVTYPYFKFPARFATRRDRALPAPAPKILAGREVAVVAGSAHEAFLKTYFPLAAARPYPDRAAAAEALRAGQVDYLFGDGLGLALWLAGGRAEGCCAFAGGPYLDSRYFGEGIGFLTRREDQGLRRALDITLQQLYEAGRYGELYLRFFPVSPF